MASDVKKWPFWGFKSNLSAFRSNFLPFYPTLKSRNVDNYKKWAPDIKKKMGPKNWIIETQNRLFEVKIYFYHENCYNVRRVGLLARTIFGYNFGLFLRK